MENENDQIDWPEWIEEIFDDVESVPDQKKRFSWKFVDE